MAVYGSYLVHNWVDYPYDLRCVCSILFLNIVEPTQRRYIRNPNEQEFNAGKMLVFTSDEEKYDDDTFVPVQVKAGRNSQQLDLNMCSFIIWTHVFT
jgi:hypothetical protein